MPKLKNLFLLFSIFLFSCQQTHQNTSETEKKTESPEDSLYHSVIKLHDEAMSKIGKLQGYQKILQVKIDSLEKELAHQKNKTTFSLKQKYELMLASLQKAETGMNNWMDSFNPEPKLPSKTELEKYWTEQHLKTKKMRDAIMTALDSVKATIPQ
jgi:hypothetical protein